MVFTSIDRHIGLPFSLCIAGHGILNSDFASTKTMDCRLRGNDELELAQA